MAVVDNRVTMHLAEFITSPGVVPPHVVVITPYDPSILGRISRSPAQIVMFKPLDLAQFREHLEARKERCKTTNKRQVTESNRLGGNELVR